MKIDSGQSAMGTSGWQREIECRRIRRARAPPPPLRTSADCGTSVYARKNAPSSRAYGRGRVPCGCAATGNYIEYNDGARGGRYDARRTTPRVSCFAPTPPPPRCRRCEYRVTRATTLTRSHPPTPRVSYVRRSARVILHPVRFPGRSRAATVAVSRSGAEVSAKASLHRPKLNDLPAAYVFRIAFRRRFSKSLTPSFLFVLSHSPNLTTPVSYANSSPRSVSVCHSKANPRVVHEPF